MSPFAFVVHVLMLVCACLTYAMHSEGASLSGSNKSNVTASDRELALLERRKAERRNDPHYQVCCCSLCFPLFRVSPQHRLDGCTQSG